MPTLGSRLDLERCPHCGVDRPDLPLRYQVESRDYRGHNQKFWQVYSCSRCGNLTTAYARSDWQGVVVATFPSAQDVDGSIPEKARQYLVQALSSLHAPAGAVMLAASAVDAMLKEKEYRNGNLYSRIEKAAEDHLITPDMARWAHEVRLDANEQRHADELAELSDASAAQRTIDFALALGQFLFTLPARVQRGLADAAERPSS